MGSSKKGVKKKENIWNVPNFLTFARLILAFVVVYLIVSDSSLILAIVLFVIAALTDTLDGWISRKYNLTTEFGKKADLIVDRFLWGGVALAFLVSFSARSELNYIHVLQVFFLMARDLIEAPAAFYLFLTDRKMIEPRITGKLANWIQAIGLPALILSVRYEQFSYISIPLSILGLIFGIVAGFYYYGDFRRLRRK